MKKIIFLLIAISFLFMASACKSAPVVDVPRAAKPQPKPKTIAVVEEPAPATDWTGVYRGIIPAASSPGINVEITLNIDQSFVARYAYVDRKNTIFTWVGTFKWDETGSIIKLDYNDIPPYYRVGENILIQLDREGNTISSDFEDMYILKKKV